MPPPQSDASAECDRAPVHRPGAIQAFGFLIAFSSEWDVVSASSNVDEFLGLSATKLLGRQIDEVFRREAVHELRNRFMQIQGSGATQRVFGINLLGRSTRSFDCSIHYSGELAILEAEPSCSATAPETAGLIRSIMNSLDTAADLDTFIRQGARQMQLLTGFDRVMACRFNADGSGDVIAESVRRGADPFHGLRFPARDMPTRARSACLRNPLRIIGDVDEAFVPILSALPAGSGALDLSSSTLRPISPAQALYLRNMGVAALLRVSIIVAGRLWGVFVCHYFKSRWLPFDLRTPIELFSEMFSLRLEIRERQAAATRQAVAYQSGLRLLSALAADPSLLRDPDRLMPIISPTLPCDGATTFMGGQSVSAGCTPPVEQLVAMVRHLQSSAPGTVFATDRLGAVCPDICPRTGGPAGALAIPMSAGAGDYIMLFRRERIEAITWAGNPYTSAGDGMTTDLSPRTSFAAWTEEVRGRAEPFSTEEQSIAEMMRVFSIARNPPQ